MQVTYTCVDGKDVQLEHEGREYSRAVSDKGEISAGLRAAPRLQRNAIHALQCGLH